MRNREAEIRIGVVGLGFARYVHVPAFRRQSGCVLAAICGSSPVRAESAAADLGIPRAAANWRELIEDPAIDALAIAVPPILQPEIAMEAALRGKHIFCEKPLGVTLPQVEKLAEVADAHRVIHAVDFLFPEIPAWRKAREMLPTIGTIHQIVLSWRLETRANRSGERTWKVNEEEGGGTLSTFVSHSFYYLEWMFGPIARLTARLGPRRGESHDAREGGTPPPYETTASFVAAASGRRGAAQRHTGQGADTVADLWMELESGAVATTSVSAAAHLGPGHTLEVYGSQGTLLLRNSTTDYVHGFELHAGDRNAKALERVPVEDDPIDGDGRIAAVSRLAGRFIGAIASGGSVEPNLQHGLRVQHLLHAAREASEHEQWIDVGRGAAR